MKTRMLVATLLLASFNLFAQGKFASEKFKSLIGKSYKDQAELSQLNGFVSRGGSMITNFDDPEKLTGQWFMKGSKVIVLFERVDDENGREIIDVLEISGVRKNQEVKIGDCRDGEADIDSLVALVTTSNASRVKAIKAWNLNRDKERIEACSEESVTCLGAVGDD